MNNDIRSPEEVAKLLNELAAWLATTDGQAVLEAAFTKAEQASERVQAASNKDAVSLGRTFVPFL